MRVLIVKCGALGDVLRTTALLAPLHEKHPGVELWWLTAPSARALLEGNPLIHRIVEAGPEGFARLTGNDFDWVWCLEEDSVCASLQEQLRPRRWTGVELRAGALAYTPDSEAYYGMSLLRPEAVGGRPAADALKRANRLGFERIWLRILGLPESKRARPMLALSEAQRSAGGRLFARLGLDRLPRRIGISPGAGARWPAKRIPDDTIIPLARRIQERWSAPAVLLGGPAESARNARLAALSGGALLDAGSRMPLKDFAALVERLDAVVAADSLTLHIANALARPLVAAFGPTSPHEISLVRGVKLSAADGCGCFYKPRCAERRPCLGRIPIPDWESAIEGALAL